MIYGQQKFGLLLAAVVCFRGNAALCQERAEAVDWDLKSLDQIGGHKVRLVGSPRLIETPQGSAVEFDGASAVFLDMNPLVGMKEFTAEVVFRPSGGGGKEQRFVHFQEAESESRLLFELRLVAGNRWFLDTFIKSGQGNYTLFAEKWLHAVGPWYHAAIVMDGTTMRHYVNGVQELSMPIAFTPQKEGQTSIGARQNKVSWYDGAIRRVRISPRVLQPGDFLRP